MSKHTPRVRAGEGRANLYDEITCKIIAELEAGRVPWVQPWGTAVAKAPLAMPKNAVTSRQYSGINILILWGAVIEYGFAGQSWLTFRQALSLGGHVRKGERGITLVYADRFIPKDEKTRVAGTDDDPLAVPFLKRFTVFRTGTGEQRDVNFAGDIAINLNSQTSLAIRPATASEHCIELITGEAAFTIAERGARSLAVFAAGGKTITDVGQFDVRYTTTGDRPSVSVTCFGGKAHIEHNANAVSIGPGQRVRYDAFGMSQIVAVDPVVETEWRRGIVEFRDTPITEVIEEINRYRPGRIILMSPTLGQKQINGRFRIEQMDEVLQQLQEALRAKAQHLPGGIVLLS